MQIDSHPILGEPPAAPPRAAWAIGTAVLGRPAYINTGSSSALPTDRSVEALRRNLFDVLDAAMAAGVDWVDTARSYGRAEEFVAAWFDQAREPDVALPTVSSKWGYRYVGQWRTDAPVHEVKEHSLARFREQWEQSRALLGDVLGLYQVHSLTVDSPLFDAPDLLEAMAHLTDAGVALGFSTSGPNQAQAIERAMGLAVDGRPLFSAVQSTWNMLERSVGPALQAARDAGLTVLVKEALANGRLVTEPPALVQQIAEDADVGPDAVALAAAASLPFVDRVLLGPTDVHQLQANLLADKVLAGAPDTLAALDDLPAEEPERYWAARAELPWH